MPDRALSLVRCALFGAALPARRLPAPPAEDQIATLDNQITGNQSDPALTSALEDPILTDPGAQPAVRTATRCVPPTARSQAQYPPGRRRPRGRPSAAAGHREMQAIARGEGTGCGARFDHDRGWARRLPAAFPVFPGARVTEAAGNDAGDCRMRVVTFTSEAPPQRVLDWYRERAAGAGYTPSSSARARPCARRRQRRRRRRLLSDRHAAAAAARTSP